MNSINFQRQKKFPLSTQVLDFLQNVIKQAHKLALLGGGDKYGNRLRGNGFQYMVGRLCRCSR